MKAILGLKLDRWHDTGAALVLERNGKIQVIAISQERLDRIKNSRSFPIEAIDYCLSNFGITLSEVNLVVADYICTPQIIDRFSDDTRPPSEAKKSFFAQLEQLSIPYFFVDHHLCHVASAFYASGMDLALGLVIDGHGSNFETQTIFHCARNKITRMCKSSAPGVGLMYTAVTKHLLNFGHLEEGKTMGLAGWGRPNKNISKHFVSESSTPDTPILDTYQHFFSFNRGTCPVGMAPSELRARTPEEDPTTAPFSDYAYAAQAEMERQVLRIAHQAKEICSDIEGLCYSGGVALNIPANRMLIDSGLFDEIFIQPAASDTGIPLGAALLGYYEILGGNIPWKMHKASLGRHYSEDEISQYIDHTNFFKYEYNPDTLAALIGNNYLVAWFDGGSEFGPRALGHRSILCSPCDPNMKQYLNDKVKKREMFRPFAPIVTEENQHEFFDLTIASPFMLINARVLPSALQLIPAAVHIDGTARVQTIDPRHSPRLHALLKSVGKTGKPPVLVNTSLNLAGEPIVETPQDAINILARSNIDLLAIGNWILSKKPIEQILTRCNQLA